jgi:hypothetical protein
MIAQYRPEIARVAEETVVNLKELEGRIETLKGDLAALCSVIGHPAAAHLAVTPARLVSPTLGLGSVFGSALASPFGLGTPGTFGNVAPWANPYTTPFAAPFASQVPFGVAPFAGSYLPTLGSPIGVTPFAGIAPSLANAVPFQGIAPFGGIGSSLAPGITAPIGAFR